MPAEDDISIEEKRVYAGSTGRTDVYVASGSGLIRVAVSGDKIGEFSMCASEPAHDVAVLRRSTGPDWIAVATDDDLRIGALGSEKLSLQATEVGSTTAVGVGHKANGANAFLAAGDDGDLVCVSTPDVDDRCANIDALGAVEDPRAIDSGLIAAADGVYRIVTDRRNAESDTGETRLEHVGLTNVTDVAGRGVPLAATSEGLYWLGNGWMDALETPIDVVAADGDDHALAASGADCYVHEGSDWGSGSWRSTELPTSGAVTALEYGPGIAIAATDTGALCVDAGDGWRHQLIGVTDIGGLSV